MVSQSGAKKMWGHVSGASTFVALAGLIIAATLDTIGVLGLGGEGFDLTLSTYGDAAVGLIAAAVMIWAALVLEERLERSTWLGLGLAIGVMSMGDALWAFVQSLPGAAAGASVADVAYITGYVIFTFAVLRYWLSLRDQVDFAWVLTETLVATSLLGATLWVGFLAPVVRSLGGMTSRTAIDLLYVFLDVPMLFAPVLGVLLTLARLKERDAMRAWMLIGLAVVLTLISDVGWFWDRAQGGWQPGSLVDFCFMASNIFFATASVAMLEVQSRRRARAAT